MRVRTITVILILVMAVVVVIPFLLLCLLTGLKDPLISYARWLMKLSAWILRVKVETQGLENIDRADPCIFMANHESFLDGPLLFMVIPRALRVILKKSVFRLPVVGIGMRHVGFVPVDRKRARGGVRSIDKAAALMNKKGWSFLIFPEGTRSLDGRLQDFKRGGFFLALASGAPIAPVTIGGTFELMPKGSWWVKSGTIRVAFHETVAVDGYSAESMPQLIDQVKGAIAGEIPGQL